MLPPYVARMAVFLSFFFEEEEIGAFFVVLLASAAGHVTVFY